MDVTNTHSVKVTKQTLLKLPDSDLADIFSGKVKMQDSSDGKIFMDKNAEIFCLMLDYLRNSVRKTPFKYEFKMSKV